MSALCDGRLSEGAKMGTPSTPRRPARMRGAWGLSVGTGLGNGRNPVTAPDEGSGEEGIRLQWSICPLGRGSLGGGGPGPPPKGPIVSPVWTRGWLSPQILFLLYYRPHPHPRTPELFHHTWAFTTPATRHTATETNHCPLASATQIPTPVKSLGKIPHLDLLFLKRLCIVHCLL